MVRIKAGLIALALFGIAGALYWWRGGQDATFAACVRVGIIMGLLWFALPDFKMPKNPLWLAVGAALAAGAAFYPKAAIPIGGALLAYAFFKPRVLAYLKMATGSTPRPARPQSTPAAAAPAPEPPRPSTTAPGGTGPIIRLEEVRFRRPERNGS